MNFTSVAFYILFGLTILGILLIDKFSDKNNIRNKIIFLIVVSAIYSGWQDLRFALIIIIEAVIVYYLALKIEETNDKKWLRIGVIIVLGCLGVFKYFNFFIDSFKIFGLSINRIELILPIGISFYSFSAIGYMLDVYRKKYSAEKNLFLVMLYMMFFTKLTAGPIIAADKFMDQFKKINKLSYADISEGLQIILCGIIKKNVLSDHVAVFVDAVYSNVSMYNAQTLLLAVFGYGIQIYLDFSGYSDMAIGCSKCLGFDMPRNFNLPYMSRNVTEFWKRWHISLSEWLMRYLYISLGGNRNGYVRTLINLLLTMAIGGLWHGASWNFVLWGIFHGLMLCVHKHYMKIKNISKTYVPPTFNIIIGIIFTFIYANFCWIFFRIEDLNVVWRLFVRIFTWSDGVAFYSSWTIIAMIVVCVATVIAMIVNKKKTGNAVVAVEGFYINRDLSKFGNLVLLFLVVGIILALSYAYSNPFIYANF